MNHPMMVDWHTKSEHYVFYWETVIAAMETELERNKCVSALRKIKPEHVYPHLCPVMRVKYAMQIFSNSLAAYMEHYKG